MVNLPDYLGLSIDYFIIGRCILGLAYVPVSVGGAAQNADFALLCTVPFTTTRTLQNLGSFIFSNHALKLQEQLIFWPIRVRRIYEDGLNPLPKPLLSQQDLIGIFTTQTIGREGQNCLNLTLCRKITDFFKAGPEQCGPTEALVLEDPFSGNVESCAFRKSPQRCGLTQNRVTLLLLIR